MKISSDEQNALRAVLVFGDAYGYGNLIAHLQTAWARVLIEKYGMDEATARAAAGGNGYPFKMQDDLITRGEWDETGVRYRPTAARPPEEP